MRFNKANSVVLGERYHCSIISESEWETCTKDSKRIRRTSDIKTLCGLDVTGRSWDFPGEFSNNENSFTGLPKCKKCLKHSKYPLLLLGEL